MNRRCMGCMELFGDGFEICPHCGYIIGTHAEEAIHIEPGTLLHDRYIVGKVLGFGGFGVTYLGWDGKLEQKVAIKEYLPGEFSTRMPGQSQVTVFNGDKSEQFRDGLKKFIEEAKRLAKFQNEPGIVKVFDSFEENETAYIIMEYLDGETLTSYLKREKQIPEDEAVAMLIPVMESLQVVHAEGILHRDIAPDNIFLTKSGEVKLIDFGASRYATTSHSRSLTVIIKPGYSPEEQYRSRGDQGPYTDVYALAATLYKMITGKTPPDAMERRAKYENQSKDILEMPHKINKNISINRENAILNAMNVRIEDRTPDAASFIRELNSETPVKRVYGKIKKIDIYAWPLWLKISVPALLLCLITFGSLLATGVIKFDSHFSEEIIIPENIVTVPDVEGLYSDEAFAMIASNSLLASTEGNIESEYIPAGKIILQSPIGGTYMDTNATVKVSVSSGKGVVEAVDGVAVVPYVIWDTKEDALEKLNRAGLGNPEIEEAYDENVAAGQIISQSVEAGNEVDEGTVIKLVVSMGPAAFEMPDVLGDRYDEADKTLTALGLVVNVEYEKNDDVPENSVIRVDITAGTSVKRGDTVTITISSGKKTIDVADVVGKTETDATTVLNGQGFKVTALENFDFNVEAGKVISQSPAAGTSQANGATITIYVSKGKQPLTVTLDANGGTVDKTKIMVYMNSKYGSLPTPKRTGFTFEGWFTSAKGGDAVTSSTMVTSTANHALFAHWKGKSCTITFDGNGGSVSTPSMTVGYGKTYGSLPEATRTGYTFEGWFTAENGGTAVSTSTTVTSTSDLTLYAHWKANSYTVSFDAAGGSVSKTNMAVTYGGTYGSLPEATREGYAFAGWFTAASEGTQVAATSKLSTAANHTLYAHWTANKYTVSFDANGGTVSTAQTTVTFNSKYGTLPTPGRDYYTFTGWYTAASGGTKVDANSTFAKAANGTLYAQWKQKPLSGWTAAANLPAGAQIVNTKWTYTKTETTESSAASLSGWTQTGSYWNKTGSGSQNYASFPSGFDQNHSIYKSFAKSQPYTASENASTKREVSTAWAGYVYWHWMYDAGTGNGTSGRAIYNKYGWGPDNNFLYKFFGAFTSTQGNYANDKLFCNSQSITNYIIPERYLYADCQGATRWFRFDYYKCSYTDYAKVYQYKKVTNGLESTKEVSNGGQISNVQKLIQYREK